MGLCSLVISTVLRKNNANEFQRISFFVPRELSPKNRNYISVERNEMSRTFANANENSDRTKIRFNENSD